MKLAIKYRKSQEQQWVIRLKTIHPRGEAYDGVVLLNKHNFVVIAKLDQFEFNGLMVLPKKAISGCRDALKEKCTNEIVRMNGALRRLKMPAWLESCGSLREVLGSMFSKSIWPAVEIIFNEGKDSALYLGPITKVEGSKIWVHCYDSTGEWENEYSFTEDEIFRLEIQSRYCRHFNRYMRGRPVSG